MKPVLIAKGLKKQAAQESADKLSMEFPQSEICIKEDKPPSNLPPVGGDAIKQGWSIYTAGKTWLGFDAEKIKRFYMSTLTPNPSPFGEGQKAKEKKNG